ncbi:hypothetical protein GCM10023143_13160 [Compostibacter hankyongensis]|uniref:Sialidase domain-containing protein n=2 Tax=Compostibacter hankyongensis TaxID=1007089 RepID=A0ABP8FM03_9BACT
MLRLPGGRWLAAYTVSRNPGYRKDPRGGYELEIAESRDGCRTWKRISLLSDPGRDLDNAALLRLPDGALLLAGRSVRWQESYRLPVYRSADGGRTWKKLSTIDANEGRPGALGKPDKGVYEPHFHFLDDGRLAVMYANEKHVTDDVSYSQIISEKISADGGRTWGREIWVAYTPGHSASRPGMPVWTRMKDGRYIVVYEVCGPEQCNVYYKASRDGITWPVGLGTSIPGQTGGPYILSLDDGRLVVTSNRGNISVSNDFGRSWHTAARPWQPKKDYAADWTQTIWSSLYQTGRDEIGIVTTVRREAGGHNIRLRLGKLSKPGK